MKSCGYATVGGIKYSKVCLILVIAEVCYSNGKKKKISIQSTIDIFISEKKEGRFKAKHNMKTVHANCEM